jgi:hypothetical protein
LKSALITFLIAFPLYAFGQMDPIDSASGSYKSFFKSCKTDSVFSFRSSKGYVPVFFHNLGYQATFPLRMKGMDFAILGATVAGTLVLIHYDEEIDKHFRPIKGENVFVEKVSPEYTELGDYYGYILLAGLGGFSVAAHDYRLFRTSLMASQAGLTAGLWIRVGKMLSGRMRPEALYVDKEYHSDHWFGPFAQFGSDRGIASFDAFPSGHTGFAFAFATVFAKEYNEHKAVPVILYSLAGLVGISRLVEHAHWASDVFLGGIIGYYCGKQVYDNEKRVFPKYSVKSKRSHASLTPFLNDGTYGLTWNLNY